MPSMSRWFVRLDGEIFDLEEFPKSFPESEVYATAEGAEVFLTGAALNKLGRNDTDAVRSR